MPNTSRLDWILTLSICHPAYSLKCKFMVVWWWGMQIYLNYVSDWYKKVCAYIKLFLKSRNQIVDAIKYNILLHIRIMFWFLRTPSRKFCYLSSLFKKWNYIFLNCFQLITKSLSIVNLTDQNKSYRVNIS